MKFYKLETAGFRNGSCFGACDRNMSVSGIISQSENIFGPDPLYGEWCYDW